MMELQPLLERVLTSLQEYPLHLLAIFLAAWVLTSAFILLAGLWPGIQKVLANAGTTIALTGAGGAAAGFAAFAVWYLWLLPFTDHVEPTIASVSWVVFSDHAPLYHALDHPARYSLLYGPMLYLLNGLSLRLLGPSVFAAKFCGVGAALASQALILVLTSRRGGLRAGVLVTGASSLWLLFFQESSFWARGDPLILLCVAAGLLIGTRPPTPTTAIACGALLGLSVNIKIHAALYFLPMLTLLAVRGGRWPLSVCMAAAGIAGVLPFLVPTVSLKEYFVWLRIASTHGFDWNSMLLTTEYAVYWLAPLLALAAAPATASKAERSEREAEHVYLGALLIALLLIVIVAGTPGAGPHHLIPMIPVVAFYVAPCLRGIGTKSLRERLIASALVAVLVTAFAVAIPQVGSRVKRLRLLDAPAVTREVSAIMARYPGRTICMGYGTQADYVLTFFRAPLVWARNPYLIDAASVMDMKLGGLSIPNSTYVALARCEVDIWLIPRGARPFSMRTSYEPYPPLFEESFQRAFLETHALRERGRFFDLWFCRQSSARSGPPS
jgi:hypothetical protein